MDTYPHHRGMRRHRSQRGARYRKNAAIGLSFGFFTIIVGIALAVFRWGLFEDHSKEFVLGFILFALGYLAVMVGCSFWAKAKRWSEAIVLIGLAPLSVFGVFPKLLFYVVPQILFTGMLLMLAMMVAIIAVLPDRR